MDVWAVSRGDGAQNGVNVAGSSPICRAYADEASEGKTVVIGEWGGNGMVIRPEDGQGGVVAWTRDLVC